MQRYSTKTFFLFLLAFLGIIALAFGVALLVSPGTTPAPVDNVAVPR